jgi:putative transposase
VLSLNFDKEPQHVQLKPNAAGRATAAVGNVWQVRARARQRGPIRRIQIARADDAPLWLLTNDLHSPAAQIAQLYKQRWQIELFFKWIKQHLQVKRFLGRSQNAVRIQLLVALIVYLLVLLYKRQHRPQTSLWHVVAELRHGLMLPMQQTLSAWHKRRQLEAFVRATQPQLL